MTPFPPPLTTSRLRLHPFVLSDAEELQQLVGAPEVAATTLNIPHPYPPGAAEDWIRSRALAAERGGNYAWAVTLLEDGTLLGSCTMTVDRRHLRGWVCLRQGRRGNGGVVGW